MRIQDTMWRSLAAMPIVILAIQTPAAAWEQQGMKPLPGGGLMLKEVPGTDPKVQDLPGVRLNPQALNSGGGNCTQRQANSVRFGERSTVNECNFGAFSVTTYSSGSGSAGASYNPFPVPGPLQQAGPPPGSGGYAPRQRSVFD